MAGWHNGPTEAGGGAITTSKKGRTLDGDAGFLLSLAGGRLIRNLNRELESFGLRARHYTVLMATAEHGGLSQRELGELLGIDPSAVVALVDDLQREGYVRRDPHPDDRRTRLVVITDSGRDAFAKASELATKVDDEALGALDEGERAQLVQLLRRIVS
ncbi:MarR family winged helix-turn-helix transcriptional regulator [Amycolatopsis acididurans]|uniref:MarR family winged helix-turn-helix transcriptional regulator n=1 Tax=Amycolatopsis acididurans TaxID=2724524 RepID=UPI0028B0DCE0|nr:MarR family transcriptional regulator [Amycolatopsis acididurans]